jgi:hypothetical protein
MIQEHQTIAQIALKTEPLKYFKNYFCLRVKLNSKT